MEHSSYRPPNRFRNANIGSYLIVLTAAPTAPTFWFPSAFFGVSLKIATEKKIRQQYLLTKAALALGSTSSLQQYGVGVHSQAAVSLVLVMWARVERPGRFAKGLSAVDQQGGGISAVSRRNGFSLSFSTFFTDVPTLRGLFVCAINSNRCTRYQVYE